MLKEIGFKNYKAYDDGRIHLKPITILLGANSSGKSSILQLILMIEQTLNINNGYESALKLNGKHTSLGEIENIFKNRITKNKLTLSFGIEPKRTSYHRTDIRHIKRNAEMNILDLYYKFKEYEKLNSSKTKPIGYKKETRNSDISKEDILIIVKDIKRIKRLMSKMDHIEHFLFDEDISASNLFNTNSRFRSKELHNLKNIEINEYYDAYLFLESLSYFDLKKFKFEFDIKYSKKTKNLLVSRLSLISDEKVVIEYEIQTNNGQTKHLLKSDIFENKILNKYRIRFGKNVTFDTLNLIIKDESNSVISRFRRGTIDNEIFSSTVFNLFNLFSTQLNNSFHSSRINYISPLRAFPKRYYFLDESNVSSSLDSIDGDNLTEILKKEKTVILKVNKWLNKFGLTVGIEDVKEVIHRLKVNQNGLNLDITDVGFGISQVLPIIVQGFLSKENSLTIIEQPEIHLHPMMQAELADLFIDVVDSSKLNNDKILLIETHSEAILKRLRRRIAEGRISNEDVAIYFVNGRNKKNSSAKIEQLEISKTGAFDWPKEFYSTDFEDTTEYLKHQ